MSALRVILWLVSGIIGSISFWLVQVLTGGPTIPGFIGQQIVAVGGYPQGLSTLVGWGVHLGVSLSYSLLFGVVVLLLRSVSFGVGAAIALFIALGLGWGATIIAPPAISVTISLLGGQGWPAQLYPLNTQLGLPFWNHILFFVLNWAIQALGPRLLRRA
ncbi:MAG: hypothetical protein ACE5FK_07505 [Candidatus Methylomirabilia bacterium]